MGSAGLDDGGEEAGSLSGRVGRSVVGRVRAIIDQTLTIFLFLMHNGVVVISHCRRRPRRSLYYKYATESELKY